MLWYHYLLGALLIVVSVIITAIVLMQESKSQGVSGVITGASSDNFFGNSKDMSNEARLSRLTKVLAIVFFVLVLASFLILLFA